MPAPKVKDLFTGNAGFCWNVVCCPIVAPLALIFKSFQVYCGPCVRVLLQRIAVGCVWRYLFPCCFVYEDKAFAGPKALGDHSKGGSGDGGETAKQMEKGTDWVRAHELVSFEGKRPQLFEGEIEPSDLCQGAVGDWYVILLFHHLFYFLKYYIHIEYIPVHLTSFLIFLFLIVTQVGWSLPWLVLPNSPT